MSQRTELQLSDHRCVQRDTGKTMEKRLKKYFQYFDIHHALVVGYSPCLCCFLFTLFFIACSLYVLNEIKHHLLGYKQLVCNKSTKYRI